MRRLGALVGLCATLAACQDAPTPPSESFQFPLAVFIQGKPNDFWDAVLSGMRTRLNLPGVQLAQFGVELVVVVDVLGRGAKQPVAQVAAQQCAARDGEDAVLAVGFGAHGVVHLRCDALDAE